MKNTIVLASIIGLLIACYACTEQTASVNVDPYTAVKAKFGTRIDLNNLLNYANQPVPSYITKNNSRNTSITDAKATLGRVLFYDKSLSIDNSIACGSCHKQEFAFSDTALASRGVQGGLTSRHSMRIINARFADEAKFFWDERAANLEAQTTKPIQDHAEMGFSGQNGRPDLNSLINKLNGIDYYKELFQFAYGTPTVTEQRLQESLASFIRSIQSFDSKFDIGRATAPNDGAPFQNFTPQENMGKQLFLQAPVFDATGSRVGGGFGCQGCHRAPEFDIDPNSRNNGVTRPLNNVGGPDLLITRSPTLRDAVNTTGGSNGPFMHSGAFVTLPTAIGHYNIVDVLAGNTNLDPRLRPGGNGQRLNMTPTELSALVAFIRTLSGRNVYTDVKWSNPF
ncbi:cytochrome-c peroxidase [Rudanella paleaurantiibacter]|uniref:Cytochrome-c peroxidase n=1 Tax=Rudanella paleaurantiibacter TaxID=2614655 RepID=A0A7J5TWM8_9BACT|nr:cytochrome c peroxidase [Rudanella paleaurantiibacter]KAB7729040.1 cytochrome-c peroxidase [Rudanella paleaurantiibacter]